MDRALFGTDGVRGPAGLGHLSPPSLARLGLAVASVFASRRRGRRPLRALLGRDTRLSGPAVSAAVSSGLLSGGVAVHDGGVLPTPAVALLVREEGFDLGVVVSASHNPWEDNGVKLLGRDGRKLDDATEHAVETAFASDASAAAPSAEVVATPRDEPGARDRYERALGAEFRRMRLRGVRIVVDAGHGAQSGIATEVLRRLGATVTALHDAPDGRNINRRCGALHTGGLRRAVRERRAHLGIAFDGDADRLQLCDESGRLLDGDAVLAALAPRLAADGRLPGGVVVGTSMTNGALEALLTERGLRLVRTPVGDRHVVAEMARHGHGLGGEPSGHLIVPRDGLLTGDGLRAALLFLRVMTAEGIPASAAPHGYRPWPLEIVSMHVERKTPLDALARTAAAIADAERALGRSGRIVVRYSGTEPKVRVMVEARTKAALRGALAPVVAALREEVGAR
jgi:phosphoglucosamine mutase